MSSDENKNAPVGYAGWWLKFKRWMADTGKQFAIAILIVVVLRSSIIEPYKIPSGSMIPTLFIGDHIFVNKFAYGFKYPLTEYFFDKPIYVKSQSLPKRGDIIVFRFPHDVSVNYIKRVIGLPGDKIAIRDKILYINDKAITEVAFEDPELRDGIDNEYDKQILKLYVEVLGDVKHPVLHDEKMRLQSDYGPIEVPNGQIFAMGDNRDRSSDSRSWGFVPLENIKGRAMFIWLNFFVSFEGENHIHFRPWRFGTPIR